MDITIRGVGLKFLSLKQTKLHFSEWFVMQCQNPTWLWKLRNTVQVPSLWKSSAVYIYRARTGTLTRDERTWPKQPSHYTGWADSQNYRTLINTTWYGVLVFLHLCGVYFSPQCYSAFDFARTVRFFIALNATQGILFGVYRLVWLHKIDQSSAYIPNAKRTNVRSHYLQPLWFNCFRCLLQMSGYGHLDLVCDTFGVRKYFD